MFEEALTPRSGRSRKWSPAVPAGIWPLGGTSPQSGAPGPGKHPERPIRPCGVARRCSGGGPVPRSLPAPEESSGSSGGLAKAEAETGERPDGHTWPLKPAQRCGSVTSAPGSALPAPTRSPGGAGPRAVCGSEVGARGGGRPPGCPRVPGASALLPAVSEVRPVPAPMLKPREGARRAGYLLARHGPGRWRLSPPAVLSPSLPERLPPG